MLPVTINGLSKTYPGTLGGRGIQALKEVSFDLHPGEVFGLLGPNGAGKTTLIKSLMGLLKPTGGSCEIFGFAPSDHRSRQKVGYLAENHRYPRRMTGKGLLKLSGRLNGLPEAELEDRVAQIMDTVGMSEWSNVRFSKYSKGMAQRVGIAQALLHDPDLLALDEPNDGVDPVGRAEFGKLVRQLRDRGKTILINSHALAEVEQICDRVAILNRGELMKVGKVSELTALGLIYVLTGEFKEISDNPPFEVAQILTRKETEWTVRVTDEENIDKLTDWLRSRNAHIRSLKPGARTLEDVFVTLVSQKTEMENSASETEQG